MKTVHHWHIVYDRLGPGAQPVGSIAHDHAPGPQGFHLGHRGEDGRQLPWGRSQASDPMAERMRQAVVADDPASGKIWVPPHLRDRVH